MDRFKELVRTRLDVFEGLTEAVRLDGFHDHRGHRVVPVPAGIDRRIATRRELIEEAGYKAEVWPDKFYLN